MPDYAPTKVGFPMQQRIARGYETLIDFPLNGKAPRGFHNHKLEFGAEVVRFHPAHIVVSAEPTLDVPFLESKSLQEYVMRRRAFNLNGLYAKDFSQTLMWSKSCSVSMLVSVPARDSLPGRFRNADTDTLLFVHKGSGRVLTDFGILNFNDGDFVYMPQGTTYAIENYSSVLLLMYEFTERLMVPKHYWLDGYPFPMSALEPALPMPDHDNRYDPDQTWGVYVKKHEGPSTCIRYPFSPFGTVAWEGEVYPFILHLNHIRALSSPNFHIDPKALTIFVTRDESASVQAFLPRWVHSLPYPHQNNVDEVLFNHSGYSARPEFSGGFMTLHPKGTFHGPDLRVQRVQLEQGEVSGRELSWRDEVAVMLESRDSLHVLPAAHEIELRDYETSWYRQHLELLQEEDSSLASNSAKDTALDSGKKIWLRSPRMVSGPHKLEPEERSAQ